MNNKSKQKKKRDEFQQMWDHRKQEWEERAGSTIPDDASLLHMAELARKQAEAQETTTVPFPVKRRTRWIPYAAAASLLIGIAAIGINQSQTPAKRQTQVTETNVEGQTILFMCNNGCTAQEVLLSVNDVIKK